MSCVLFLLYWIETLFTAFYGKKTKCWKKNIVSLSYFAKTLCKWDFFLWRNLKLEPKLGQAKPKRRNRDNTPSYLLQRFPVATVPATAASSWDLSLLEFGLMSCNVSSKEVCKNYRIRVIFMPRHVKWLAFIKLLSFSKQTTLTTLRYWRKGNVFFPNRFSL